MNRKIIELLGNNKLTIEERQTIAELVEENIRLRAQGPSTPSLAKEDYVDVTDTYGPIANWLKKYGGKLCE